MPSGNVHLVDALIVVAYLALVILISQRASAGSRTEEGFFLAGRKLGKLYQFFLAFGNATDASGAVTVSSLVYQQGISGVWLQFQTVFMNPYYWFMYVWFRRVRLVTTAELFEDRFGDRALGRLYAFSQIVLAISFIGFGNLLGYKLVASLWTKDPSTYTATERASVESYREWRALEGQARENTLLSLKDEQRLTELRRQAAGGELRDGFSPLAPLPFYLVFSAVVAVYIVSGGLTGVAFVEALQGVLILVFSAMLLPFGLSAVGGWRGLREHVPDDFLLLFAGTNASPFSVTAVIAILFVSLIQIHAMMGNMGLCGSARNEFAARFGGATGTYAKRLVIILWALSGLVAVALYRGARTAADPDGIWGVMSRDLLPTGLIGLMVAGVLAGKMSVSSNQAVAMSALFGRNLYSLWRPDCGDREAVLVGRIATVVVLALGIGAAFLMGTIVSGLKLLLLINVPFGAAIALVFVWRRLTAPAVWTAVILSAIFMLIIPTALPRFATVRTTPALLQTTRLPDGQPGPALFFESIRRTDALGREAAPSGHGRFNVEIYLLAKAGFDVGRWNGAQLLASQFFVDRSFPFAVLLLVSLVTRPVDPRRAVWFYGKLKTPVGATPDAEAEALALTERQPGRFDHLKLWPNSSWEFTRWDRTDAIGFLACCALSAALLGLLVLFLRWLAALPHS